MYTSPMATTRTTKKVSKKASSPKTVAKQSSSQVAKMPKVTLSDLQKKVMDPSNRRSLILAIIVIALGIAAFLAKSYFVAALVNGQPISRLAVISELEKKGGKETLEVFITRALVVQEASKRKITASDKDVDAVIAQLRKDFQAQGQNLDQYLASTGYSQAKFREDMKIQALVIKILGNDAKLTDKEFNDFLAKNQDLIKDNPDQAKAKEQLRGQMEQQKLQQKSQEWLTGVRKNAKIQYLVNY